MWQRPTSIGPTEGKLKISARNTLQGKVKKIEPGSVNMEVVIDLSAGQEIVSIITRRSADELGLKVGKEVMPVIKASSAAGPCLLGVPA